MTEPSGGRGRSRSRLLVSAGLVVVALGVVAAVVWPRDAPSTAGGAVTSGAPIPAVSSPAATPSPTDPAELAYERMTPQQRVGQLFAFGVQSDGATSEQLQQLAAASAGNVFLRGHQDLGVDGTRAVVAEVSAVTTYAGVSPFVSADQEGGGVQSLDGAGFDGIPSAVRQGRTTPAELQGSATQWGQQLRAAGVNLNLAPVADVVPADVGRANAPIGAFSREFGTTPTAVGPFAAAFVRGMTTAGVATSVKHFPGIGRASGNTDSEPDVTDPTTRTDAYLAAFADGIAADAPMVMMSSATYPAIDPDNRACFSAAIMTGMLRGDLGFEGVIISDSFGSSAVAGIEADERALRFFRAGGTMLLNTRMSDLAPMSAAVLSEAAADPAFAELVERNVRLVLEAKESFGLLAPA